MLDAVLTQYDARAGTRKVTLLAEGLPEALAGRRIDALLAVGDPTDNEFTEIVSSVAAAGQGPPVFLPILEAKALSQRFPAFEPADVPLGSFGGDPPRPAADLKTISVSTRLVARTKAADGTVGEMVRVLFARRPPDRRRRCARQPHERRQPRPLRRADAAPAATSRTAREAASSARLDELEREADTVLGQALEAGSLRHLDAHRVTALGLAIDQVRLAIRDRRRQIEAGDPTARVETPRILAG